VDSTDYADWRGWEFQKSMNSQIRHPRFQFTLRALFIAVTAACVFFAFPQFVIGVLVLLLGVVVAGTLLTLLVFLPVQNLLVRSDATPPSSDD
jgi:hypothetical protein